jgi:hypothetical protein
MDARKQNNFLLNPTWFCPHETQSCFKPALRYADQHGNGHKFTFKLDFSGSHSSEYEDNSALKYGAAQSRRWPTL